MDDVRASLAHPSPAQADIADAEWWRGAVIYQIYPRSFQDSNGDGIGDLAGIVRRLPHVATLGVDAIWISPFFKSPMRDFGYDISDYRDVDPMFGTLDDFDALIAEAHRLGMKVMIDLVMSHTALEHPWFLESRVNKTNPKADWFVWADPKPDGTPPNNWLSMFGGSAWQFDSPRRQYYLHNFLAEQPDLNFHNPEVQEELLDIVRFWLERGVDGFRLDVINFYFHSKGLEDNPPLHEDHRNDSIAPSVNPYNYQDHLYDKSQPENLDFLRRFRALLDEYPGTTAVGEVGDAQRGLDIVAAYTAGNERVHMCYAFDFLQPMKITAPNVRRVLEEFETVARTGWSCWAFSNHDVTRHASRWGEGEADPVAYNKIVSALLFSLRGSVCLYQGEELGLPESELAFEDLRDPYGIRFWPEYRGRDGCRTPMVWEEGDHASGFSDAVPWLPVSPAHGPLSVSAQVGRPDSVLEHYRRFLAFRRRHKALVKGSITFLVAEGDALVFERRDAEERMLCAFNLGSGWVSLAVEDLKLSALDEHGFAGTYEKGEIKLGPYGAFFASMA